MHLIEALFGIAALILPVTVIWLFFSHLKMRKTVKMLEGRIDWLDRQLSQQSDPTPIPEPAKQSPPTKEPSPWEVAAKSIRREELVTATPAPAAARAEPVAPAETDTPPKSYVFGPENLERLYEWLKENWFYAIAALSLAMAGIFLVQYGVENGILSPTVRVFCAISFGVVLIGFAEWVRRRAGDGENDFGAFLPSTFAGAGLVSMFAGTLAARQLYGLIGPEVAFSGLIAIAALALLLGWLYGPLLSAIGLIGATAAPFIVGGNSASVDWLFYYFALVTLIGLAVDAMKRSAWVSAIGLSVPYVGAVLVWLGSADTSHHLLAFAALVAMAATCIPTLSPRPAFGGAMSFAILHQQGERAWPDFPVRLAAAGILVLASIALIISISAQDPALFWLALIVLAAILAALAIWLTRTNTLDDLALPVSAAALAVIALQGFLGLQTATGYTEAFVNIENPAPKTLSVLVGYGLLISAFAAWRSFTGDGFQRSWGVLAAIFAPAVAISLSLFWQRKIHHSDINWAVHILAIAAFLTFCAERALRQDGENRLRTAIFAIAALNMIAFALSILFTKTALTLGLAGLVVSAAWLDRKFDIKQLTFFVQPGVIVCSFRLIADPGLSWALRAPLPEVTIGFVGVIALLAVAWWLLRTRARSGTMVVVESACWSLLAIFICLLLHRGLREYQTGETHWSVSLFGLVWLISAANQFYRAQIKGFFQNVRLVLGAIFAGIGLLLLGFAASVLNPLYTGSVLGPPLLDSMLLAYGVPALLLGAVAWRFTHLDSRLRLAAAGIAAGLMLLYIGLEIRRLWQGPDLTANGVLDGELYSYTIAMLLAGSGALLLALYKRSGLIRKVAVGIIALTIAKVFLIDMSGLEGLVRVLSFLALGLVLAGLAFLNRWITKALPPE